MDTGYANLALDGKTVIREYLGK
ncbi:hypothetical protein BN2476_1970003 [Paraburkholderia piptadeniae]|uniref:Uncharacterized protein n=1 Tax=Paraburkholderia piptadeniae TaxID=1701573 RepID=A0A1N7SYT3_9BURK|nr:hypothetical protein BN2476_1970003 [Paraburkholderia piptadeniae]